MRSALLALLAALPALACGPSTGPAVVVPDAEETLQAGNATGARTEFERALELIGSDPEHPLYLRAKLGAIEAMAFDEPELCVNELFALAIEDRADVEDFERVGRRLIEASQLTAAVTLIDAAPRSSGPTRSARSRLRSWRQPTRSPKPTRTPQPPPRSSSGRASSRAPHGCRGPPTLLVHHAHPARHHLPRTCRILRR